MKFCHRQPRKTIRDIRQKPASHLPAPTNTTTTADETSYITTMPTDIIRLILGNLSPASSACFGITYKIFYAIHWELHGPVPLSASMVPISVDSFPLRVALKSWMSPRIYHLEVERYLTQQEYNTWAWKGKGLEYLRLPAEILWRKWDAYSRCVLLLHCWSSASHLSLSGALKPHKLEDAL